MIKTYGEVRVLGRKYYRVVQARYLVIDQSKRMGGGVAWKKYIRIRVTDRGASTVESDYHRCPICGLGRVPRRWMSLTSKDSPIAGVIIYECGTAYILGTAGDNNAVASLDDLCIFTKPATPALIDIQCVRYYEEGDDVI